MCNHTESLGNVHINASKACNESRDGKATCIKAFNESKDGNHR